MTSARMPTNSAEAQKPVVAARIPLRLGKANLVAVNQAHAIAGILKHVSLNWGCQESGDRSTSALDEHKEQRNGVIYLGEYLVVCLC